MQAINLKAELNALGIPFILIGYPTKAPAYPYGIFTEDITVTGDDTGTKRIVNHEIVIEVYHKDSDDLLHACATVEAWLDLNALDYVRKIVYVIDEQHFLATYELNYTSKRKGVLNG